MTSQVGLPTGERAGEISRELETTEPHRAPHLEVALAALHKQLLRAARKNGETVSLYFSGKKEAVPLLELFIFCVEQFF